MLIGIDEVGRGCWAGPMLVVAACQTGQLPSGLNDSKKLSKKQREAIFPELVSSFKFGEGWVEPNEIDKLGLSGAMRLGVGRALSKLGASTDDRIIMDGKVNFCSQYFTNVQCIVKADSLHPVVSAASIYAKVIRDKYMVSIANKYPDYLFENHVGYGTQSHLNALKTLGITEIHRKTYKPIQAFL